jgi:hypothetical protein
LSAHQDDYEYLTSWVGYPSYDSLWQSYSSVKDVDIFRKFAMKNIDNPLHVTTLQAKGDTCRSHTTVQKQDRNYTHTTDL